MKIYEIKPNISFNARYSFDPYLIYKPEQVKVEAEPNEELKPIDLDLLKSYGIKFDKIDRHQPLEAVVKRGKVKGTLVDRDFENAKQPYIALVKQDRLDEKSGNNALVDYLSFVKNQPQGIIITSNNYSAYKHEVHLLERHTGAIIFVDNADKFSDFIGQNVVLDAKNIPIKLYKSKGQDVELFKTGHKQIKVPILEKSNDVLSVDEITDKNAGSKAYNQKRLKEFLSNNGYSDITVPEFVVIPWNMVEEIMSSTDKFFEYEDNWDLKLPRAIEEISKDLNKNLPTVIARSDFNCEDLPDFPAPGNYLSTWLWSCNPNHIISGASMVGKSKDRDFARYLRLQAGIKDEEVQPSVIIQKLIRPNYFFTLYTKDDDGKLRLELVENISQNSQGEIHGFEENQFCPYRISFDRNNGELNFETIGAFPRNVILDENYNLIKFESYLDYKQKSTEELSKIIKYLTKVSLDIEKYFGSPQDIEGGILDGKIYLWQTRNI